MDHLWDDPVALADCGATCRAWLLSSRLHLFHSVAICNTERCASLLDILETSPLSPVPFATYVRHLTISKEGSVYLELETDWTNEDLLGVLPCFNEVRTLILRHLRPGDLIKETMACLCTFSSKIQALHLESVDFRNGNHLRFLLFNYPELSSISFKAVTWAKARKVSKEEQGEGSEIKIRTLVVEDTLENGEAFGDYRGVEVCLGKRRRGSPLRFCLHELRWASHMSKKRCIALDELLVEAGKSLKHFTLAFHPHASANFGLEDDAPGDVVKLPDEFTLLTNTHLRTLEVVCPRDGVTRKQCAWVPALLSSVHSKYLREIRMIFGSCGFQQFFLDFLDWERVDEALVRLTENIPALSVVFQIGKQHELSNDYTRRAILARLPKVVARGVRIGMSVTESVLLGSRTVFREVLRWED